MMEVPSNTASENDLNKRLAAVKRKIQKAAGEALATAQNEQPILTAPTSSENDSPKASYDKAFAIFEQDAALVEQETREKLNDMEAELKELTMKNDEAEETDPEMLKAQAEELTLQIAFLKECSLARTYLDQATTHEDWVESAKLVAKVQTALDKATDKMKAIKEDRKRLEAANSVLDSIRIPLRRKRVDLLDRAESIVGDCCVFGPNSIEARSPGEALTVLQALGAPLDAVQRIADELQEVVFEPLLENHRKGTFTGSWIFREDTRSEANGQRVLYMLNWTNRRDSSSKPLEDTEENQVAAWGDTLKLIQKVMTFLEKHVLLERPELCEIVGLRLFGGPDDDPNGINLKAFGLESALLGSNGGALTRSITKLVMDKCIPCERLDEDQIAKLPAMAEKLHGFCQSFETEMAERHLLNPPSPITEFCKDFDKKYAEKRRAEILGDARDVLLNNDYHNTIEVGEDVNEKTKEDFEPDDGLAIFKLHKCSISKTTSRLFGMCRGAMDEAVDSPAGIFAPTLYRTARELLDLFRALIPATQGSDIESSPRTAAVFHNDCVFLAHECLTLGLEYKEKFRLKSNADDVRGQMLQQSCMFVDMVPPFRELANRCMGDMIEKHQQMIIDMVGSKITLLGDALSSNESLAEWTDAETALVSGVNHLRHLSVQWKPILSSEVYAGAVGILVDTVYALYVDRVLEATDISESACHYVSGLFCHATRKMSSLISTSRLWNRFEAIGKFMDMGIAQIESALADGVFRDVTGAELSRLIVATFDDSDKRKRLLQALASD